MNHSTLRLWSGILWLVVAYLITAVAVVSSPLWALAAVPFGLLGLGMVTAAIISIGVRWGMQDVREQELLDDDELVGAEGE